LNPCNELKFSNLQGFFILKRYNRRCNSTIFRFIPFAFFNLDYPTY